MLYMNYETYGFCCTLILLLLLFIRWLFSISRLVNCTSESASIRKIGWCEKHRMPELDVSVILFISMLLTFQLFTSVPRIHWNMVKWIYNVHPNMCGLKFSHNKNQCNKFVLLSVCISFFVLLYLFVFFLLLRVYCFVCYSVFNGFHLIRANVLKFITNCLDVRVVHPHRQNCNGNSEIDLWIIKIMLHTIQQSILDSWLAILQMYWVMIIGKIIYTLFPGRMAFIPENSHPTINYQPKWFSHYYLLRIFVMHICIMQPHWSWLKKISMCWKTFVHFAHKSKTTECSNSWKVQFR